MLQFIPIYSIANFLDIIFVLAQTVTQSLWWRSYNPLVLIKSVYNVLERSHFYGWIEYTL